MKRIGILLGFVLWFSVACDDAGGADSRVRDLVDFDGLVEAQDDDLAAGDTQKQDEAEEDSAQSDQDAADQGSETAGDFDLIDEDIELIFSQPGALEEEQPFTMSFGVEPSSARLYALNLPPGASWDVATRTLSFTPDFTQGGRDYSIDLQAVGEQGRRSFSLDIAVNDSIAPPAPRVVDTQYGDGFVRLRVEQTTDTFLDSPGYAGRTFSAYVMAPSEASSAAPLPVRLVLHGFGGEPWQEGWSGEFRIAPHDPENTYWWGYGASLPGSAPSTGEAPPYTARRVMHLLDWVLRNYSGADAERVYIEGGSMGGAGAAMIGLRHARHFAWVHATIGQTVARNHRPSRIAQLSTLWGSPEASLGSGDGRTVWDAQDLTLLLQDEVEARQQFITTKHGKDDPIIHFGAVIQASPITDLNFYQSLQEHHVGHLAVWDEGAHGPADPVLGEQWWEQGLNPIFDAATSLRRDQAFVAFSQASHDNNPGDGGGNGQQSWSDESGYAGDLATPGDTGWNGDRAGVLNRLLRWDARALVDTVDRFELPIRVIDGAGSPPPDWAYPPVGDEIPGEPPITADLTLRRVQAFQLSPGEVVQWRLGSQSGTATANAKGELTLSGVAVGGDWQTLQVERVP